MYQIQELEILFKMVILAFNAQILIPFLSCAWLFDAGLHLQNWCITLKVVASLIASLTPINISDLYVGDTCLSSPSPNITCHHHQVQDSQHLWNHDSAQCQLSSSTGQYLFELVHNVSLVQASGVPEYHPSPIKLGTKSFCLLPCWCFPFSFFFHQSKLVHLPNQQCPCHHQVPGSYTRECLFFNTFVIFTLPTSKRLC